MKKYLLLLLPAILMASTYVWSYSNSCAPYTYAGGSSCSPGMVVSGLSLTGLVSCVTDSVGIGTFGGASSCSPGAVVSSLSATGLVSCVTTSSGAGASVAGVPFVTSIPSSTLDSEVSLSPLPSGFLMNTTGTGIPFIYSGATCSPLFVSGVSSTGLLSCSTSTTGPAGPMGPEGPQGPAGDVTGPIVVTDVTDTTKQMDFNLSNLASGTTTTPNKRTKIVIDEDGTRKQHVFNILGGGSVVSYLLGTGTVMSMETGTITRYDMTCSPAGSVSVGLYAKDNDEPTSANYVATISTSVSTTTGSTNLVSWATTTTVDGKRWSACVLGTGTSSIKCILQLRYQGGF
jgi:hypothetical protein